MKKLLGILVLGLFLITPSKANDISEFEIEGMSIGDSALDFFTKNEIVENIDNFYEKKKYTTSSISSDKYDKYEILQISYRSNDKLFNTLDITGVVFMDYNKCMKEIENISLEFDQIFTNTNKDDLYTYKNNDDPSGKSKVSDIYWYFDNGDVIVLACFYVDAKWGSENNHKSEMRVSISTDEFNKFLIEESK